MTIGRRPARAVTLAGLLSAVALVAAPAWRPGAAAEQQAVTPLKLGDPGYDAAYGGWRMFHVYCYRCHGTDAVSNPSLPGKDLRTSIKTVSAEEFFHAVRDGRPPKGMPAWGPLLTDKQMEDIYAYLQARASGALKPGRPDEQ